MNAQVGIGNTNPQAILDIAASNIASPSNTDGILVPRVDDFSLTDPTSVQDGMLIFITGNGTPTKGFYYWDQISTSWVEITTGGRNTLDQAYDEGGSGVGASINATDGALRVDGDDGFVVTGTFGSGNTIDTDVSNTGTRFFFNPNKAALRAGYVSGSQWNNANIGNYSVALGESSRASHQASFSAGSFTIASGRYASAFGRFTEAASYAEFAIGSYPTTYTPTNSNALDLSDRAFVIGNSTISTSRSNAFEVWKDGRVIINESYTLPTADGIVNQVLTTDGSGSVTWATTSGSITANNGLTEFGSNIRLGGALSQNTGIVHGVNDLSFNLNNSGEFRIQDNSSTFFEATDLGTINVGRNFSYSTSEILNVFGRLANSLNYVANFENTYNGARGNGISIRLAATAPNGNHYYAGFFRSGGNLLSGRIAGTGTGVIYVTASDRRLKNSIIDIPNSLELIDKIQPRLYEYNDIPGIKEYGFIAQELQPIYPQAVSGNASDDVKTNPMMVDYGRLTPILTAGVKELNTKLETQQTEIETLKLEIEALKMFLNNFDTHLVTTKLNKN
ncbi:tail fiber domain-containing protein [Psychroserpens sp.]